MTDVELAQIAALAGCTFSPGSTPKRVVAQLAAADPAHELSPKMTAFIDRLAHQYRRQIGRCMSVACVKCNPVVDRAAVAVALDAFIEGRSELSQRLAKRAVPPVEIRQLGLPLSVNGVTEAAVRAQLAEAV